MDTFFVDYLERMKALFREFEVAIADVPPEGLNWQPGPDMNSIAVLIIHTAGSTRFWIGDIALAESSNRDRSSEFAAHQLDATALQARLAEVERYIETALPRLTDLAEARPVRQFDQEDTTVGWALLHALEHTAQHVGHVQMTRQLWEQHNA